MDSLVLYVVTLGKSTIEHKESINLPDLIKIESKIEEEASPSINRFQELLMEMVMFSKEIL